MSDKMKVIAIVDKEKAEIKEVTRPVPGAHQILMKIKACAICTWEQRMFTRDSHIPLPFVGGHEIAGLIEDVGSQIDKKQYPIGKKIAARLIRVCGKCYFCRHGEENLCVDIDKIDDSQMEIPGTGGLSEYLNIDESQVYFIPDDLPFEHAVFSEPLACVVTSIEKGKIDLGDDVVVIGGGIMGMLHVMCAKRKGGRVIVSEPDETRRKLAIELGADIAFNPIDKNPIEFVKKITEGRGADVIFNTTPIASVAQQAIDMTGRLGRCVMYSSMHPDKPVSISPNWLHKTEAVITGSVSPGVQAFYRSVSLLSKGIINPEKLISGVYEYKNANEAFCAAVRPDTFRIVIKF